MMTFIFYAIVSAGLLMILLIAACLYIALRYSGDDESEYEQHERFEAGRGRHFRRQSGA